jgi:hypothetical protein
MDNYTQRLFCANIICTGGLTRSGISCSMMGCAIMAHPIIPCDPATPSVSAGVSSLPAPPARRARTALQGMFIAQLAA